MIKFRIVLLLFCLLFGGRLFAQSGIVTGIVMDATSGERIPFASVSLLFPSKTLITGTVSGNDGAFLMDQLKPGQYMLVVRFMGYQPDTLRNIVINGRNEKRNLGKISLTPLNVQVGEVQIEANRKTSSTKIDRQTYHAADFATAKGGTAVELLSKLPSVSVDPDGTISVKGTSDFMVYLNGKPTQLEPAILLGQISGAQIENIEIISIPTSRYDAQGKGGIINVTTRKSGAEGLSIAFNGLGGLAPGKNTTDIYSGFQLNDNRYGGGVNLLYFKNKLTITGGINYNDRNVNGKRIGDARILVSDGLYRHMIADGERPEWYRYLAANLGLEYQLSPASSLSGSWYFGTRTEGRSAFYVYDIFYAGKDKVTPSSVARREKYIYNPNTDTRFGHFQNLSLDYGHRFNKQADIKVSLLFERSALKRELENQNFQFNNASRQVGAAQLEYHQTDETPLQGYRLSVDYSRTFGDKSRLNLGFQPQYIALAGDFKYDTLAINSGKLLPYNDLQNGVDLTRGVYAGYADFAGNMGKLKYIAGLRLEYADQSLQLNSANYFSLFSGVKKADFQERKLQVFPNLHLDWDLTSNDRLTFASSRRISRPPVKNMAPFLYRRHLEVYEVGDPRLQPEYMVNAEAAYERKVKKHNFTLTGFYRGVNNAVFRVNTVTNEIPTVYAITKEEVLIRSYTNAGNSSSLGAELNANLDGGKNAKFFIGGSLFQYRVKGDIFGYKVDNSSLNWSLKSNANLSLSKSMKFSADFSLKSATVTAQGQNDLFYQINSSLVYTPAWMKGWELSFRYLDLLNSNVEGLDTKAFNLSGKEIFYQETTYYRKGGIVELGLSYAFNKKPKNNPKADNSLGKEQF